MSDAKTTRSAPWSALAGPWAEMFKEPGLKAAASKARELGAQSVEFTRLAGGHWAELAKSTMGYQVALMTDLQKMNIEAAKELVSAWSKEAK